MQTYINQLLADLENAKTNQPPKVDYKLLYPEHPANDPLYEGMMDYMMEWDHAPEWTMNDLFGIDAVVFPPIEKLNGEQTEQLVQGILELWASFNIGADILIRASLSDEFSIANGKYFDNDIGMFSSPHLDALDINKCEKLVLVMENILLKLIK